MKKLNKSNLLKYNLIEINFSYGYDYDKEQQISRLRSINNRKKL